MYPKKFMTINELVKIGFSREELKKWVNAKDFPSMRSGKNGNWRINTDLLDAWLIKKGFMKKPSEDLLKINLLLTPDIQGISFVDELIKIKDALQPTSNEHLQRESN